MAEEQSLFVSDNYLDICGSRQLSCGMRGGPNSTTSPLTSSVHQFLPRFLVEASPPPPKPVPHIRDFQLDSPLGGFDLPSPTDRLPSSSLTGAFTNRTSAGIRPVCAKVYNAPKYCLRSDILRFFEGCNLTPDKMAVAYDSRYRPRNWHLEFDTLEDFQVANALLTRNKFMWPRPIRLEQESKQEMMAALRLYDVTHLRDRTLLMINLPEEVNMEDIERFFEGYSISGQGVKLLRYVHEKVRTPRIKRLQGEWRKTMDNVVERRALVCFTSELEALRALRERQGEYVQDMEIELKLIQ
ncbi:hypothetical protein CBR_g5643 [Chara braunii]|uniref:RRM domain-containing protein n=1 Tax=Chara braunii TaxID=69332 RepID=A0A388JRS0_CHABU|nr:hypothetical protein CBR_g5643 [Chara braunii]|eukprot:GBG60470.1 hypothetical protein CBR_g5643 [Chara braunii]